MHDTPLTPIHVVQGTELESTFASQVVKIRGVVTGHGRKGYFVQDPTPSANPYSSDAVFIYSPRRKPRVGDQIELLGKVVNYVRGETGRPTTQLKALEVRRIGTKPQTIKPVWLTAETLPTDGRELARFLNGLEGMLVGIPKGATFAAPSNPFGDYVCIPPGLPGLRAANGGMLVDPAHPERWLPGFRITNSRQAPKLNVGATLLAPVVGPLNYRSESFQIVAQGQIQVQNVPVTHRRTSFKPAEDKVTVLTLNGFNLDVHVESPGAVSDPDRDIDDDVRYGRFELLAKAIVEQAGAPDIIALQEIQDNDGAEISDVVEASETYRQLIRDILHLGGPKYRWADIPPRPGGDGGQPGGNIRNAYLYDPKRVDLVKKSLRRLGTNDDAYEDSRKPLRATFRLLSNGAELVVVNVHLASKRHQNGMFAPTDPGKDAREPIRVRQASIIREDLAEVRQSGDDFYVTGDFNDFEFSRTLKTLCGDDAINLVETLKAEHRFDYNHRGQLQVLMHGIVSKKTHAEGRAAYEILHGNELAGIKPGGESGKPSDHAYVVAQLKLVPPTDS